MRFYRPLGRISALTFDLDDTLYDNRPVILRTEREALAKLYCARTAMEVIDDAIQIMGGLGYTDEARVSRFWRDVRCERIGGGTDEIMIYVAGRQILKDYQNK